MCAHVLPPVIQSLFLPRQETSRGDRRRPTMAYTRGQVVGPNGRPRRKVPWTTSLSMMRGTSLHTTVPVRRRCTRTTMVRWLRRKAPRGVPNDGGLLLLILSREHLLLRRRGARPWSLSSGNCFPDPRPSCPPSSRRRKAQKPSPRNQRASRPLLPVGLLLSPDLAPSHSSHSPFYRDALLMRT